MRHVHQPSLRADPLAGFVAIEAGHAEVEDHCIGPQLLGHTVINLVLSDIDATTVSVTIMAEPVIAIAAAFILFDEVPSWLIYPGGALILLGVYLVSTTRRSIQPILE